MQVKKISSSVTSHRTHKNILSVSIYCKHKVYIFQFQIRSECMVRMTIRFFFSHTHFKFNYLF